jgi:predicted TIM-barrel fold metal-dependent hydrolase
MSSSSISSGIRLDLSGVPLIDHHAHPIRREPVASETGTFRRYFSESSDPRMVEHLGSTVFYRRAIRDLAALYGCAPTEKAVLATRAAMDPQAVTRHCLKAANIALLLLDTGFNTAASVTAGEMAGLTGIPVHPILRVETYVEALIPERNTLAELEDTLRATVRTARAQGIVALKSIAAYRGGLQIKPRTRAEAGAAFTAMRATLEATGQIRLVDRRLLDYVLLAALEEAARQALPVQFHVAFGDDDADLRLAHPLHLRSLCRDRHFQSVPIILLHCYPYVREAGYLTNLYAHVYVDLSLGVPLTAAGSSARFAEALELAPASKVLFATDAHSIPELFYLGALHGRRALARCLEQMISEEYLTPEEAEATAHQILWQNAQAVYGVGGAGVPH